MRCLREAKGEGRRAKGKLTGFHFVQGLTILIVAVVLFSVASAAPPPRPLAGKAVVMIPAGGLAKEPVPVYESPGVRRVAEIAPAKLPAIASGADEVAVPVLSEKGDALQVVYDEAGREGWITRSRSWQVLSWTDVFKSHFVRFYAGLKPAAFIMRKKPDDKAEQVVSIPAKKAFRILVVQGNWGQALLDFTYVGWVKWRDEDGRLLVVVE